jgi:hypothetical protein
MIAIFVLIVAFFFIPMDGPVRRSLFLVAAVLGLFFLILGVVLIVMARKSKLDKKLKIFLIIMGASAIGPLVGSILHNVFYAFGILSENIVVLRYLFEFLHVAFFLIALLVCPLGFIVGVVGSLVMVRRKRKRS